GQVLLTSDRTLAVEGLELHGDAEAGPLVRCEGGALRLDGCLVTGARQDALVVCRGTRQLELHDCRVISRASAVCVEAGARGVEVRVTGTTLAVKDHGAALEVRAAGSGRPGSVRLTLEGNTVRASRVASFHGLTGGVRVTAAANALSFREALLSFSR